MPKFIDLTGQRFGRLTIVSRAPDTLPGRARWNCVCDCGTRTVSRSDAFKNSKNASCGCYNNELSVARLKTHGKTHTPEYKIWQGMRSRCKNPSNAAFYKYGARGIIVCQRWHNFEHFFADMGKRPSIKHSIDRLDGTKNYQPDNCRWATARQQQNNLKNNVRLSHKGKSLTVGEWSKVVGLKPKTIQGRMRLGWSVADALTLPIYFNHGHGNVVD